MRTRRISFTIVVSILFLGALPALAATVLPTWFDYEQCDFCKAWGHQPGLIAHTHEEVHNISDGIVWFTSVDKAYRDKFTAAMAEEQRTMDDMQAGKSLTLCQYCNRISQFAQKGVRIETVEGSDAVITLYTSTDSALVSDLQRFGVQAMAEEATANASFIAAEKQR